MDKHPKGAPLVESSLPDLARIREALFGDAGPGVVAIQQYLTRFGYLQPDSFRHGVLDERTSWGLAAFQRRFGLPVTGIFDGETRDAMSRPRCGLPDSPIWRDIAYKVLCKWKDRAEVTFAFDLQTSQVSGHDEFNAIRAAFLTWQAVIALDFREVRLSDSPDILIGWRGHPDADLVMGASVLAHADYPPGCSIIVKGLPLPLHFDSTDTWTIGAAAGAWDVESVALHEIGHLIGLDHSTVMGAVMWPSIADNTILNALAQDDIDGAQSLYGRRMDFPLTTSVAVLSRNSYQLDVFAVNRDGGVYSAWWNNNPWRGWFRLFGTRFAVGTPVASMSRNSNQMDLYAVGQDGRVHSSWWNGNPWRPWFPVGSREFRERTPIATLTRSANHMDLFAVGLDGRVYSAWWDGGWHDWFQVGTGVFDQLTPIATISRNSNQMDIFAVGLDGGVYSAWWNGSWHDYFRVGTAAFWKGTPLATLSRNPNHMEVFAVGLDGGVYAAWWNGNWNNWFRVGSGVFEQGTPIAAVSRNPNQMDLFAVGLDGGVYSAWWNGVWNDWFRVGTLAFPQTTPIAAICRDDDHMDLFAVGMDGHIYSAWWDGQWHDWFRLPINLAN